MNLDDRTILVTGAGKGIGRTIALRLADQGARVVVTGHALEDARRTRDDVRDRGGGAVAYEMDVTSADGIRRVVEGVTDDGEYLFIEPLGRVRRVSTDGGPYSSGT